MSNLFTIWDELLDLMPEKTSNMADEEYLEKCADVFAPYLEQWFKDTLLFGSPVSSDSKKCNCKKCNCKKNTEQPMLKKDSSCNVQNCLNTNKKLEDTPINNAEKINASNSTTLSAELLAEYQSKKIEEERKAEKLRKEKELKKVQDGIDEIKTIVLDALRNRTPGIFSFVNDSDCSMEKNKAYLEPAVSVTIEDKWPYIDAKLFFDICEDIKDMGGFKLVTATRGEAEKYIYFYLILQK